MPSSSSASLSPSAWLTCFDGCFDVDFGAEEDGMTSLNRCLTFIARFFIFSLHRVHIVPLSEVESERPHSLFPHYIQVIG
jgi:hypothetical protein